MILSMTRQIGSKGENRSMRTISIILILIIALAPFAQSKSVSNQKSSDKVEVKPVDKEEIIADSLSTAMVLIHLIASLRNSSYVEDLTHQELSVFEDGVKQDIQFFNRQDFTFDLVLMLDTNAGSAEKLQQMKSEAIAFVERLRPTDRIKVIAFDDSVRELCGFTDDRSALLGVIASIKLGQGNKLYDAIHQAIATVKEAQGTGKAMVILNSNVTKDNSNFSDDYTLYELTGAGVLVYPICYSANKSQSLKPFAERTGGQFYLANSPSLLADVFAKITRELSAVCWLGYYPTNRKRNGTYRKIEVRATRESIVVRTPSGYFAPDDTKQTRLSKTVNEFI